MRRPRRRWMPRRKRWRKWPRERRSSRRLSRRRLGAPVGAAQAAMPSRESPGWELAVHRQSVAACAAPTSDPSKAEREPTSCAGATRHSPAHPEAAAMAELPLSPDESEAPESLPANVARVGIDPPPVDPEPEAPLDATPLARAIAADSPDHLDPTQRFPGEDPAGPVLEELPEA